MLQTMGIVGLLLLSMQSYWVALMAFFLCYHIDVCPDATAIVLGLEAPSLGDCRKPLSWTQAASCGNNYITYSFHTSLLGRLHGLCFYAITLTHALTPLWQCWVWTLRVPRTVEKRYFWAHAKSRRNDSNAYVSPLACYAAIMAFLTVLRQIVFTKIFPLCNMNSHKGGLQRGTRQPRHEWVVPNNSDRLRFKHCYYFLSS